MDATAIYCDYSRALPSFFPLSFFMCGRHRTAALVRERAQGLSRDQENNKRRLHCQNVTFFSRKYNFQKIFVAHVGVFTASKLAFSFFTGRYNVVTDKPGYFFTP